jgi:hypothetical protein
VGRVVDLTVKLIMRIAYPTVTSCGLGNNLITIAKAYLIAQACRMTYQPPVWPRTIHVQPVTRNGYGYYFPSPVRDKVILNLFSYSFRAQRRFRIRIGPPILRFDRNHYEKIAVEDAGESCLTYLKTLGLDDPAKSVVVTTTGMWGGYASIRRARNWLHSLLLSHDDTRRRLEEIECRTEGRLKVGVNIRMGDFRLPTLKFEEGERNVRLPLDWYIRLCRRVREVCDCVFVLVTDGKPDELLPFLNEIQPINKLGQPYSDLLGILLLSHSDLIICSNSTYSRLAGFLNDKPYIWFADTLIKDPSGRYGRLWKDTETPMPAWMKRAIKSTDLSADAIRRCFALSYDFSSLPHGLRRYLASNGSLPIEVPDDLLYGDAVVTAYTDDESTLLRPWLNRPAPCTQPTGSHR